MRPWRGYFKSRGILSQLHMSIQDKDANMCTIFCVIFEMLVVAIAAVMGEGNKNSVEIMEYIISI